MSRFIRKSYLSFCFADMLNYGISLILCPHFLWKLFWKKALLHNPDMYGDLRRTVNFAGKLLRIRSSRQWRDRCLSLIWHKKSSRVKHSNESWNWFFKSSMPGALSTVLENVRPRFSQPDWLPLGLRRYNGNSQHRKESGFFYCGLASNLNISSADLQWYLGIQPSVWSVFYKFLTTLMEFFYDAVSIKESRDAIFTLLFFLKDFQFSSWSCTTPTSNISDLDWFCIMWNPSFLEYLLNRCRKSRSSLWMLVLSSAVWQEKLIVLVLCCVQWKSRLHGKYFSTIFCFYRHAD